MSESGEVPKQHSGDSPATDSASGQAPEPAISATAASPEGSARPEPPSAAPPEAPTPPSGGKASPSPTEPRGPPGLDHGQPARPIAPGPRSTADEFNRIYGLANHPRDRPDMHRDRSDPYGLRGAQPPPPTASYGRNSPGPIDHGSSHHTLGGSRYDRYGQSPSWSQALNLSDLHRNFSGVSAPSLPGTHDYGSSGSSGATDPFFNHSTAGYAQYPSAGASPSPPSSRGPIGFERLYESAAVLSRVFTIS